MHWSEVIEDRSLRDLPYKVELNERGQVVLSPATKWHALVQGMVIELLISLGLPGRTMPECPVETLKGVRVPDVAWASHGLLDSQPGDTFTRAPELCIEVISKSNTPEEIEEKVSLYLGAGALEVWTCDLDGMMRFFAADGPLERSRLAPTFPLTVPVRGQLT